MTVSLASGFVSRHLPSLLEHHDLPQALERLLAHAPAADKPALNEALEQLRRGVPADQALRGLPQAGLLPELLTVARAEGAREAAVAQAYLARTDERLRAGRRFHIARKDLLVLCVVTLLITLSCLGIFTLYVLPQFESMFSAMEMPMPAFTDAVLAHADWLLPGLALVVLAAILGLAIGLGRLRRGLTQGRIGVSAVPGVTGLRMALGQHQALACTLALVRGGLAPDTAQRQAETLAGQRLPASDAPGLNAAAGLGQLELELNERLREAAQALEDAAHRAGREVALGLQIVVAISVGLIVIAMYLPLFQIGQIL